MSSKQTISMDFGVLFNSRCLSLEKISHPRCSFSRVKPNWLCHFLIEAGVEAGVAGGGWEGGVSRGVFSSGASGLVPL